jgi:hypothetical protein
MDRFGLLLGCRTGTGGEAGASLGAILSGAVFPSKTLVGVMTVDTSETESLRMVKCVGEIGGDAERSDFGSPDGVDFVSSSIRGVFVGGAGKSGTADLIEGLNVAESKGSICPEEFFLRGISSNFHSVESSELFVFEFLRRERRDMRRVIASVASFALVERDTLRSTPLGWVS